MSKDEIYRKEFNRLIDLDFKSINKEIRNVLKDINRILRPKSRIRFRDDDEEEKYYYYYDYSYNYHDYDKTKEKRAEYRLSLNSFLCGLRLGMKYAVTYGTQGLLAGDNNNNNGEDTTTTTDEQIEEYASYYFVYDFVMEKEPPTTFSLIQKNDAKSYLINMLSSKERSEFCFALWDIIPSYLKQFDDIVFAALSGDNIPEPNPQEYPCFFDRAKILEMLVKGKVNWSYLPEQIKNDRKFVKKVLKSVPPSVKDGEFWIDLMGKLFKGHKDLFKDKNLWLQTFLPGYIESMQCLPDTYNNTYIRSNAMVSILTDLEPITSDREVMIRAIDIHAGSILKLHDSLKDDDRFVHEIMTKRPGSLRLISLDWMRAHKDVLVNDFLRKFQCSNSYNDLFTLKALAYRFYLCGFWNDEEFTNQWFKQGFPLLVSERELRLPESWCLDKEKLLMVARYCQNKDHVIRSFRNASSELISNRDFIREAMQYNKNIIICASSELREDDELMIDAIASSESFVEFYDSKWDIIDVIYHRKYLAKLQSRLCLKLGLYDSFYSVLCFISHIKPWNLLNQGEETSMKYKKTIAEFLDVPIGKELGLIRRAREHLEIPLQKDDDANMVRHSEKLVD